LNDWVDSARGKSDLAPTACPAVATVGDAQAPGMACAASFDFPASPASVHLPSGSATVAATLPAGLPEAVSNLLKRAREELRCGREAEAEALLREACSLHPHNPQIPVGAGVMALGYGRPGLARRILTDVKDRFSDCPAISRLLGVACYRLGDFSGAEAALRHALSLDNSSALSYFLLGCTLAKLGQRESAEESGRPARLGRAQSLGISALRDYPKTGLQTASRCFWLQNRRGFGQPRTRPRVFRIVAKRQVCP